MNHKLYLTCIACLSYEHGSLYLFSVKRTPTLTQNSPINMSHFAYACKMRYPLNLVLEKSEYLWFYLTFCIVILDCGLKLHKLSNHTLVMLQK